MFDKPQAEHAWLEKLVGRWEVESDCMMGPGQETQRSKGGLNCRMLGGLWLIAEGTGESPVGELWTSIMTVGFNPKQQRYIGTFVASMMTHLWTYGGTLDASGRRLPLDTEGPTFDGSGTAQYRDTIEIVNDDLWNFSSEVLGPDGKWLAIMSSQNRRA